VNYDSYKNQEGVVTQLLGSQFEYDLIKNIPKQVEKYFELQQFDHEAYLDSPNASEYDCMSR